MVELNDLEASGRYEGNSFDIFLQELKEENK